MTSDSRKQFEEWAKARSLNPVRSSAGGYMELACALSWQGWSARDSEVERLREALNAALNLLPECRAFFDNCPDYDGEELNHLDTRCMDAISLLSSQVKESGK